MVAVLVLAIALLLCVSLIVYCARQPAGRRLRLHGFVGMMVGGVGGLVASPVVFSAAPSGLELSGGLVLLLMTLAAAGCIGAYVAVALAQMRGEDSTRARGALRGGLYGLGVGVATGLVLMLISGVKGAPGGLIAIAIMLLSGAIGAMIGAARIPETDETVRRRPHYQRGGG